MTSSQHVYELRSRKDHAKHRSRSHDALIRVYDDAGNVIETHEHRGNSKRNMPPGRNFGRPGVYDETGNVI